ncbi:MAG: fibro-slime domain-containing protein [Dorea sp.]
MKHSKFRKVLALMLVLCMTFTVAMPVSAAGKGQAKQSSKRGNSQSSESSSSNTEDSNATMTLVEDESTVTDDTELRADTYALTRGSGVSPQADTTTTLKYFPVTMYNYDKTTINNATHQVEVDGDLGDTWNGIYFSAGSPAAEAYSEEIALEDGTYIIQNARAAENNVGSWLVGNTSGITSTTNQSDATQWTVKSNGDGTYTLNSTNGYMTIGSGENGEKTASTASNIEIVGYTGDTYTGCVQLKSGSYYLCQWGGTNVTVYGGYNVNNDAGNAFYFYKVTDSGTEKVTFTSTDSLPFAAWNWWNKGKDNSYGQYTYSGLVESTLTANKDITFTKPDGGIFNTDATVKNIYTGVEMPFVYKDGTYTFDASQNGVYFYADSTQGSTAAQSNGRLYFNEGNPQSNGGNYGDGSTTVWMPFNSTQSINGEANCDYHFGMRTTIPFTMTANGKMNPNDNNSEDITFSFSGDDDVWVFIDGQLVIDLGGIHNRLDATINFAENTWSISESNTSDVAVADYNGAAISGTIFNDGNTTGTLNQTRETFAATDSHELTIFYLERGAGSSNCKIQFNLPMKDIVSVTKRATQSISSDGTLSPLTAKEQETVNNIDFGFTLTKNGEPVANTNYSLLNENGQAISTPSTDANGHFTLRNGQTAKFVGEISVDGAEYQVVEDAVEGIGFKLPTYTYSGTAAGGFTVSSTSYSEGSAIPATKENLTSAAITAKGSTEAEDSLQFICENYFDANLPNPSSRPVDDQIVIDYGLPVIIDALANDVYRGDTIELTDVTGAQYGTAAIENGKITYQLTKQLTGVEVLTYTATVTGTGNSGNETTTASEAKTANIYIIPATSMYYEENFSDLVTFGDGWSDVGTAQTDPQEPGVVGTVGDSPYGSDAAYLNDSGDSNGSSKYVNTTNGEASFSYTFTGTGTSFFARTGIDSAYMRVIVTNDSEETVQDLRRNNIYKAVDGTDVGTLYNVPVYTIDGLDYGTYTVTVTLMKANAAISRGSTFNLDGIRVQNPLDSLDANASVAKAAYATDGEANMTVATLRQKLLGEASIGDDDTLSWDGTNFVVFTDSNGAITAAEEYKSNGPKEEVYLNNGQSVTFSLTNWDANSNKIYLGLKAPLGSGSVSINGNTLNLSNAADCYYDISGYAQIATDEDGIKTATFKIESTSSLVSVTNIKVTGNAEFTIVDQVDEDGDDIDVDAASVTSNGASNEEESQEIQQQDTAGADESSADGVTQKSTENSN